MLKSPAQIRTKQKGNSPHFATAGTNHCRNPEQVARTRLCISTEKQTCFERGTNTSTMRMIGHRSVCRTG